ncbi:hypothetical protein RhiirA5_462768, partial [Rhizophagus irregularis]
MEIALKEDPVGKPYVWKAVDITSERENNAAVINKTEAILTELKNKEITVCAIVTDSASAYAAARLLKIQQELQILAINFKPPIVETRHQQGETPTLPREIFEIIDSSTFWDQITLINEILDPYCKLLNLLQCDKARLFQVVHSMNYLVQFWLNYSDDTLAKRIIGRLEKRWKDWEQPLLLLSYLLHPEYRMNQFNNTISSVNYSAFGKWLMYYYRA